MDDGSLVTLTIPKIIEIGILMKIYTAQAGPITDLLVSSQPKHDQSETSWSGDLLVLAHDQDVSDINHHSTGDLHVVIISRNRYSVLTICLDLSCHPRLRRYILLRQIQYTPGKH